MCSTYAWAAPAASFSGSPIVWNAPSNVNFTDKSTGNITNWLWNFGDGTQSNERNPVHQYDNPGTYTVKLTVSGLDGTDVETKNNYIVVENYIPPENEYLIRIDSAALQKFGIYYPVTYKFKLAAGATGLAAQYRNWEGIWRTLPEKKHTDIFNGIDAVRFDYANNLAYVSVKFSRSSDTIYLRIVDAAGQPVSVDFDSIPKYYDGRRAAVTFTLDDWTSWSDFEFRAASDYLGLYGLYFSVGLIVDGIPWSSIQQKINQHGDKLEILSHSTYHSKNAAEYTAHGYQAEVIGSRDAIRNNLTFDAHPYVPVYIEPWGYYDAIIDSLIASGDYLLSRGRFWSPIESTFAAWDSDKGRYGRGGYTFSDANNVDDVNLMYQANAAFDDVLDAGGIYHLVDHPKQGLWHEGSYLLQHLNHVKGRNNVWYAPLGQLYQYHFVQEMRGNLGVQHLGYTPLAAIFTASPLNGKSPLSIAFNDSSTGEITGWEWNFGDSATSSLQNPVHVYASAGKYTVRLTVAGPGGAISSTQTNYIDVSPPSVNITSPAIGALFATPASIAITATATTGTGVTVSRVDFYAGSTLVGSDTESPYSFSWRNVAEGSYSLTARVTDFLGATATSLPVWITVADSTLPTPWETRDIGNVGLAGSSGYLNDTFSMSGSGADIWGSADSFRYVYQSLSGDGQIIARVVSQQNTNDWAKAGVMIRETLTSNSRHALMALTPGNGATFQRRLVTGGISTNTYGPVVTASYWVKLVRSGNRFSGYISSNGLNWVLVGNDTINMAGTVYVGLAVTGHNNTMLCTVNMDAVAVTAGTAVIPPSVSITAPADGASFAAPATIPISVTAMAGTGAAVSRVDFYAGTTLVGSNTESPYSFTWNEVDAGNYLLTARITDSLNRIAVSNAVGITVADNALTTPWTTRDIGTVGLAGSAGYLNGTFSLSGSGADIWGTADGFRYVYQPLSGDGQIIARVASLQNTNTWAKAGVMIRETLAANSRHALMAVTPGAGTAFQRRLTSGATSISTTGPRVRAPYWVKLERSGNTFSGYASSDGVNWALVGSSVIAMADTVYVGLAVTSHNNSALCTAAMDGVSVTTGTPVIPPTVSITSPANAASFTAPASIEITASASDGTEGTVSRVDFYAGTTLVGSSTSSPYSITWDNVPVGSYSLTAQVFDSLGVTSTSLPVVVYVNGAALPEPWATQDIGAVGVPGNTVYQDGTFTINGSGADIWGSADGFRYVYKPLTGDGQIVARVAAQQNTNSWAKGGVMIRENLTANSNHALMALTPGVGAAFQRRQTSGALSVNTTGSWVFAPYWVKLVRSGNSFSGYVSSNGASWKLVGTDTITMADTVYVGLAVTSHNNSILCTVTMDGVQ